ncbi:MAG: YfjI family protein [Methylococcaceae bacterium]|nr:YfjI family protein [Methylococcaceae bacterium]
MDASLIATGVNEFLVKPKDSSVASAKSKATKPDEGIGAEPWGDPVLFGTVAVTPEIQCHLLPGVFGEYAECLSQNLQTPSALAVMTVTSILSTALARKVTIGPWPDDGYSEPVNVWTLAVAESGERKSQILGRCMRPLVFWEKERSRMEKAEIEENASKRKVAERRADKLEGEAAKEDEDERRETLTKEAAKLRADLPDERFPVQIFTGDATPEAGQELLVKAGGRMAFISDEPGLLLVMAGVYSGGEAILDVFLQGYSGNDVRGNRRCRSAIIERPAVTLGLSIQPGILSDFPQAAKRKFRASGLFARFFPVFPRSNIGRRDVRRRVLIPDDLQRAYDRAVMDLLDFEPDGGEAVRLALDDEAREVWLDFADQMERGQAEGGDYQDIRDWIAKLPGGVLRLAGLFHMAEFGKDGAGKQVNGETMASAILLALNLIEHARAVFGLVGADKSIDDAKSVWAWIEQRKLPGFLRSEAHRKFHSRFGKVEDLIAALEVLKGRELIRGPYKSKGEKGGRPSEGYRVNPIALGLGDGNSL